VTPLLTRDKVIEIAKPKLQSVAEARLAVNFNGLTRTWFVVQYRLEADAAKRLAVVVVDDDTLQIIKSL
jgi:hypothetical protein